MSNDNRWRALSQKDKAFFIQQFVRNGINTIDEMERFYNSVGDTDPQPSSPKPEVVNYPKDPYISRGYNRNTAAKLSNIFSSGGPLSNVLPKPFSYSQIPVVRYDGGGPVENSQNSTPQYNLKYLGTPYIEYYSHFDTYDDFLKNGYPGVRDADKKKSLLYARYFYNLPGYKEFYDLVNVVREQIKLSKKHKNIPEYILDFGEPDFKLKSIENGKPTNKHTMGIRYNILDYLYNQAVENKLDPRTAIALAVEESNLGNGRAQNNKINVFDLMSYWVGIGEANFPNSVLITPYNNLLEKYQSGEMFTEEDVKLINKTLDYNTREKNAQHPYEGDSIVADAINYYKAGKYNADPKYPDRVESRWKELMNDPRIAEWWESKGYVEPSKEDTDSKALGGQLRQYNSTLPAYEDGVYYSPNLEYFRNPVVMHNNK